MYLQRHTHIYIYISCMHIYIYVLRIYNRERERTRENERETERETERKRKSNRSGAPQCHARHGRASAFFYFQRVALLQHCLTRNFFLFFFLKESHLNALETKRRVFFVSHLHNVIHQRAVLFVCVCMDVCVCVCVCVCVLRRSMRHVCGRSKVEVVKQVCAKPDKPEAPSPLKPAQALYLPDTELPGKRNRLTNKSTRRKKR